MRLIDADALNETFEKCKDHYKCVSCFDMTICDAIDFAEQYVSEAQTIDAVSVETLMHIFGDDEPCNYNGWDEKSDCDYCRKNCENHKTIDCWRNALKEGWFNAID